MGSSEAGQQVLRKHSATVTSPSLSYVHRRTTDDAPITSDIDNFSISHQLGESKLGQGSHPPEADLSTNPDPSRDHQRSHPFSENSGRENDDCNKLSSSSASTNKPGIADVTSHKNFRDNSPHGSVSSLDTVTTLASSSPRPSPASSPSCKQKILCIGKKRSEFFNLGSMVNRLSKVSLPTSKNSTTNNISTNGTQQPSCLKSSSSSNNATNRFLKSSKSSSSSSSTTSGKEEEAAKWREVGDVETLRRTKCRRLYAKAGQAKDVALFYKTGKFFAMDAWCSHMGGPLYEGDIEDYNGSLHVLCPWHAYMFDVTSGRSDIGLRQDVFPVKTEKGNVFIKYTSDLSIYPYL